MVFAVTMQAQKKTHFDSTNQKFKNGQIVWHVVSDGDTVGQFWPVNGINIVTTDTDPQFFEENISLESIQRNLRGIATAPDGMTSASIGAQMEGKCLSHGKPCGDGFIYDYGIIVVSPNGFHIDFTHKREFKNFDSSYNQYQKIGASLFFLPSVYRNGSFILSEKLLEKVFIKRDTPNGEQIGVIIFDNLITYNQAREIVLGLDRKGKSKTTHIYMLDGGSTYGQACKEINGQYITIGTRQPQVNSNYLVFY